MKIFRGNDAFLTTEYMIDALKKIAYEEAHEGEYHPAEHTCWIAADMIQKLVDMVENKAPEVMLRELADRLETIEFFDKKDWVRRDEVLDK